MASDESTVKPTSVTSPRIETFLQTPWFPGLPIVIGVIAVSFSSILIAICHAPAGAIGMYRLAITVVLLLPVALRQWRALPSLRIRDWAWLGFSGVFLGLHFLFWIASIKQTSIASSMFITALQPVFVGLGALAVFGERLGKLKWLSMCLAILGTIVIGLGDRGQAGSLLGDLESFLGTVAISVYMLTGQGIRKRLPSTFYNACVFGIASLTLLVYDVVAGITLGPFRALDWLWLVLLALIPTLFGHALFNWLLQYVRATVLSMTILGEPIGAILLAAWLLHQPLQTAQALGGLVTLFSVWLFLRKPRIKP